MKKTLVLSAAIAAIFGTAAFATEATLIDFTTLNADMTVKMPDSDVEIPQNSRTIMDYGRAAGATFSEEQKDLMKTSLYIGEWEVVLNSSARNTVSVSQSIVKPAPVKESAKVPFAGEEVMGVHVIFPTGAYNANCRIVPPFDIPVYEPLSDADENGNRQEQTDEQKASEHFLFEADGDETQGAPAYGVVRNVGTLKSIAVTTMGMNYPHALYVLLKDNETDERGASVEERRYFMGYLNFDGWKTLTWNNPDYISEVRTREIRVYPIYPRGLPFVKFAGFQVVRDASHIGDDFIGYFKDVKIIYDKAQLTSDRDIADEDLWGIVSTRERAKQNIEFSRFGNKQVNRYLEKAKMATEESFTPSLSDGSSSNAQQNGGQAADAK